MTSCKKNGVTISCNIYAKGAVISSILVAQQVYVFPTIGFPTHPWPS